MYSRTHILGLAREIRDLIYEYYIAADGGYVHNFDSGKLRTAEDNLIDLSLMFTCKQVAHEMRGIHLRSNTITFKTAYSDEARELAGYFNFAVEYLDRFKSRTLAAAHGCVTPEMADCVAHRYPQFVPILKQLMHAGETPGLAQSSWGETPSCHREFVAFTLGLASQHPDFLQVTASLDAVSHTRVADILTLSVEPWTIPTREDVAGLLRKLNVKPDSPYYWHREKYRFSAASTAVRFLRSLSRETRLQLRNLTLHEDRTAVAYPECHPQGLIPFWRENEQLHIEQRPSLWRNVFVKGAPPLFAAVSRSRSFALRTQCGLLNAHQVTDSIKPWIMEALALPNLGIRAHSSFTMLLDGTPVSDLSSAVFDVVHRDAAWQAALDECINRDRLPLTSWFDRRKYDWYRFEKFPALLADIIKNKSIIRCNFDPGHLWDVEELVRANAHFTHEDWAKSWQQQQPGTFQTVAPLPEWLDLRSEDAIPGEPIG